MTKKAKLFVLCITLMICAICTICVSVFSGRESHIVEITCDGELIEQIDLSSSPNYEFEITTKFGKNVIKIHDGNISVIGSDCPDQVCVQMGELKSSMMPIVCLPHRLMISFVGGSIED